ncbi:nuclear transport factor 2 family protein [Rhodococcus sp. UFZ-B548]|uniref:nuclear transport factor 2 family protein n=1 Tax=Rhodococcus sp. UFZ-B548 TaxID=2742212 RepID=UPI0015F622D2|nr:ester cyclase [Rhodococcus sp. UFZ-B548]
MGSTLQLVTELYQAYNSHRPDQVADLYAPICRHRDIAVGADHDSPEKIAVGLAGLFEALPDVQWRYDEVLIDGNRAAVAYELVGHLHGRLGSYRPVGQSLQLSGVQILEVKDGAITSSVDYWDGGALHRQLSVTAD